MNYDLVIHGGFIVDGSGCQAFRADVGIRNSKIARIGSIDPESGTSLIEAQGLVLTPGFIDIHSHSDITLIVNPKAESKVRQGVTTEVVGNCGGSAAPLKGLAVDQEAKRYGVKADWKRFSKYFEKLEEGVAVNVASLAGHGTIRQCVMGMEDRAPSSIELDEMKILVDEGMTDGTIGLSSGLVYPPGRYAETFELVELCRVVAKFGGLYASHIRGERETILEALKEAIEIGERSGVAVQISHHPAKIGAWGRSVDTLAMMDEASNRGVDVTCDMHPYIGGSTSLSALLPPWAQAGGSAKIVERLKMLGEREKIRVDMLEEKIPGPGPCGLVKRGMWDKILISSYPEEWPIGRSIGEIAIKKGVDPFTVYFDLLVGSGAVGSVVGFYYNEEDIRNVLRYSKSMIGSDGYALAPYGILGGGRNHPRSYGTFPMVLRKYVRGLSRSELVYDEAAKVVSLEEAVMKMTSMPAKKLKLANRGLIKVGYWADIVVFDPETVADTASYLDPYKYPVGIGHVLVNGVPVIRDGEHTGSLPGKVLRFQSKKM
ncbi:MAG: D-aminoacylase [Candidatus Bathyarchaeota archaeon]|nr:D-aminoacylase [Candidatus Bathyarchaeota archaeon]